MRNFGRATREAAAPILRGCLALGLALTAACGSVGGGLKTAPEVAAAPAGPAAPPRAARAAGRMHRRARAARRAARSTRGSDARADVAVTDGGGDSGRRRRRCRCRARRSAADPRCDLGVYAIAPLAGASQSVFCEMVSDGGGWTAFYIGDSGRPPGGCLRHAAEARRAEAAARRGETSRYLLLMLCRDALGGHPAAGVAPLPRRGASMGSVSRGKATRQREGQRWSPSLHCESCLAARGSAAGAAPTELELRKADVSSGQVWEGLGLFTLTSEVRGPIDRGSPGSRRWCVAVRAGDRAGRRRCRCAARRSCP